METPHSPYTSFWNGSLICETAGDHLGFWKEEVGIRVSGPQRLCAASRQRRAEDRMLLVGVRGGCSPCLGMQCEQLLRKDQCRVVQIVWQIVEDAHLAS